MKHVDPTDAQLSAYAAGELSWWELRQRGVEDYISVLAGLARLGLRPPIAPPGGPNAEARERGRKWLREAILRNKA